MAEHHEISIGHLSLYPINATSRRVQELGVMSKGSTRPLPCRVAGHSIQYFDITPRGPGDFIEELYLMRRRKIGKYEKLVHESGHLYE